MPVSEQAREVELGEESLKCSSSLYAHGLSASMSACVRDHSFSSSNNSDALDWDGKPAHVMSTYIHTYLCTSDTFLCALSGFVHHPRLVFRGSSEQLRKEPLIQSKPLDEGREHKQNLMSFVVALNAL